MSTSVAYLVGIGVSRREVGGVLTRYPEILGMRVGRVIKPFVSILKVWVFQGLWISLQQVRSMVVECPQILALNLDIMRLSIDYFQMEMQRPLDDLAAFPAFFTYGLESTIKPRQDCKKERSDESDSEYEEDSDDEYV
ncbi:hypothetical protein F3Y22_tig00111848pilonHSYRG00400 [Hibiscus syriacus]|uniref:Uncharacterized protein n=1 Tax=Hibiscus syriacus TaxID=106335 RepID=A0A6A2X9V4_HIBSY|nr:hypothetical protein F3Y22_tig00111848pilonHSYRG00400 [Hibiscus syriacus]